MIEWKSNITQKKITSTLTKSEKKRKEKEVETVGENEFDPLPFVGCSETLQKTFSKRIQQLIVTELELFFFLFFCVCSVKAVDVSSTAVLVAKVFQSERTI